jgi:hypothetical protein
MVICHFCKSQLNITANIGREDFCHHCRSDLHCCLNCRFYNEYAHNKCLEPKSEYISYREKANFCEYFLFKDFNGEQIKDKEVEEAKRRLEELFK